MGTAGAAAALGGGTTAAAAGLWCVTGGGRGLTTGRAGTPGFGLRAIAPTLGGTAAGSFGRELGSTGLGTGLDRVAVAADPGGLGLGIGTLALAAAAGGFGLATGGGFTPRRGGGGLTALAALGAAAGRGGGFTFGGAGLRGGGLTAPAPGRFGGGGRFTAATRGGGGRMVDIAAVLPQCGATAACVPAQTPCRCAGPLTRLSMLQVWAMSFNTECQQIINWTTRKMGFLCYTRYNRERGGASPTWTCARTPYSSISLTCMSHSSPSSSSCTSTSTNGPASPVADWLPAMLCTWPNTFAMHAAGSAKLTLETIVPSLRFALDVTIPASSPASVNSMPPECPLNTFADVCGMCRLSCTSTIPATHTHGSSPPAKSQRRRGAKRGEQCDQRTRLGASQFEGGTGCARARTHASPRAWAGGCGVA